MKSKTLKQFLAEKRKVEAQSPEAVFPTYTLRNLRTGRMIEYEPGYPYQFRDWMLKLVR